MLLELAKDRWQGRSALASPAFTVAAALAVITAAMVLRVAWDPSLDAAPRIGSLLNPQISLLDQNGASFTNAAFEDKPRVLLFGYTSCPDICPASLAALAQTESELGRAAAKLAFVFVTVDPERDTPARLKSYLAAFSPRFVGVTGNPAFVRAALDKYHVFRARRPSLHGGYTIDHTSTVYLISADGRLQDMIKEDELGTAAALKKIKRLTSS